MKGFASSTDQLRYSYLLLLLACPSETGRSIWKRAMDPIRPLEGCFRIGTETGKQARCSGASLVHAATQRRIAFQHAQKELAKVQIDGFESSWEPRQQQIPIGFEVGVRRLAARRKCERWFVCI